MESEANESPDEREIRAGLERVTSSAGFRSGRRISALLEYLVEQTLAGNQDRIKATSIAIDVFGRDENFDQQRDPIVRVEAGRLRNKLKDYYQGDGINDPLVIDIPKGAYVPTFTLRRDPESVQGESLDEVPAGSVPHNRRSLLIALVTGLAIGLVIGSIATLTSHRSDEGEKTSKYSDDLSPNGESRPYIVVSPVAATMGDAESERLAAGLVEALITNLSKLSGLSVMAHTSVLESLERGGSMGIADFRSRYGVTHMLRGTVEREDERIVVNMQLVDAKTARILWAERAARALDNLIDLEEELALTIAQELSVQLQPEERARLLQEHTSSFEAWLLYRQGLITIMPPRDIARVEAARHLFDRATEVDPDFAGGYAGHSFASSAQVLFMTAPDPESELSNALALAQRTIALDPDFGPGYAMLALAQMLNNQQDEALASAKKSISLQPGDAFARFIVGMSLIVAGQPEQSIPQLQEALRLDPLESRMPYLNVLGIAYYEAEDYSNAASTIERNYDRGGPSGPHMDLFLAASYAQLGEQERAKKIVQALLEKHQDFPAREWLTRWITNEQHLNKTLRLLEDSGLFQGARPL